MRGASVKHPLEEQVETYVAEFLPKDLKGWIAQFKKDKIIHDVRFGVPSRSGDTRLLSLTHRFCNGCGSCIRPGAVYLTYPSAHHTRFEHTLGVLCQTGACAKPWHGRGRRRIDDAYCNDARFAALLHDTGHGPFSHTSEQFFSGMGDIADWRKAKGNFESSGAGEIFLTSQSVQRPCVTS